MLKESAGRHDMTAAWASAALTFVGCTVHFLRSRRR